MILTTILAFSSVATLVLLLRSNHRVRGGVYSGVPAVGKDLPSVSVCIAARNETHSLAQCLERVLKSDYQKLEILVLDDSSSDDTSLIIKSFATAGVRFIAGGELPQGWLGKNHAYQTLINEASGDIIVFMDVDTTIRMDTISRLVDRLSSPQMKMLSVLPNRFDIEHPSALFNTMRYHWELLLGTKISPPAASALWAIKKTVLTGGEIAFSDYALSVRPERHIARRLHAADGYRYFISSGVPGGLGVGFEKHLHSQWETASRLYYPMTHRKITNWTAAAAFLLLLIAPYGVILSWQWNQATALWAGWLVLLNTVAIAYISYYLHAASIRPLRVLVLPFLLVQEFILICISMVRYRTNSVTWKGRSVVGQPKHHEQITIDE